MCFFHMLIWLIPNIIGFGLLYLFYFIISPQLSIGATLHIILSLLFVYIHFVVCGIASVRIMQLIIRRHQQNYLK